MGVLLVLFEHAHEHEHGLALIRCAAEWSVEGGGRPTLRLPPEVLDIIASSSLDELRPPPAHPTARRLGGIK